MSSRRTFIRQVLLTVPIASIAPALLGMPTRSLKFGWVTDIHYARAIPKWNRYYVQGMDKLAEAVKVFNANGLDFAIETGDFKDQTTPPVESETLGYLIDIERVFAGFNGRRYHVLGNHDLDSLSKAQFLANVANSGIAPTQSYYWFDASGYRCVVLDACFRPDGTPYNHGNFKWYACHIPNTQLDWLAQTLAESPLPVLVFAHQLIDGKGDLYVGNASTVRRILEKNNNVIAVFQGHKHEGDYHKINHIHYITQKALVEGSGAANNCYSTVEITQTDIQITGYRLADSYTLFHENTKARSTKNEQVTVID